MALCQQQKSIKGRYIAMKTEQELKDALEDIFFDALTDTSNPPYYTDKVDPENDGYWQCKVYELCADELIKRGYGDISEYKAEIEQLKAEIKQAKIDTLNKVKKCSCCDNFFPDSKWHIYVFVDDIDKLVEEIENDRV